MLTREKIKKVDQGTIVTPAGFQAAGIHAGFKRSRKDLGLIYCEKPANAAAVYTENVIQAAPLHITRKSLAEEGKIQAVLVNSGNANACTGERGLNDAKKSRDEVAHKLNLPPHYVTVASTGVIGEYLAMETMERGIEKIELGKTPTAAKDFSEAILTTDTQMKTACYQAEIQGKQVTIAGTAKGSGMIEPNMATMLAFITTDIKISTDDLQSALTIAVDQTFNCITVDGDTSTNDHVLALASGLAKNESFTPEDKDWPLFMELLTQVCEDLAKMIAQDGEGATKLIEVEVNGAKNDAEAVQVAKAICGSSLVKTAVHGEDPNWGRVICAIGYSEAEVNPETIDLTLGTVPLLKNSESQVDIDAEAKAKEYLKSNEIKFTVDLKIGEGKGKGWGCDLTNDYIKINASYRT